MVHQTSNRHIQAVMSNFKFIIFDYLAAKKSGFGMMQTFLRLVNKQSLFGK